MEHTYLKTFYEVVKAGNITRAAESLCVTQPAVSRRIQLLEKAYGCALLDRTESVLKPTPKGRILFTKTAKIIEIERELDFELGQLDEEEGFSLVTTPTFGTSYLPRLYRDLIFLGPKMKKVRFIQEDLPIKIMRDIQKGLYDLAIVEHCLDCSMVENLITFDLPNDKIIFAISSELVKKEKIEKLENLFKFPLYLHQEGCCSNILLDKNLKLMGLSRKEFEMIVEVHDLRSVFDFIIKGHGVAFISSDLIASSHHKKELTSISFPGFVHDRKRSLLVSENALENPLNGLIVEKIQSLFSMNGLEKTMSSAC